MARTTRVLRSGILDLVAGDLSFLSMQQFSVFAPDESWLRAGAPRDI